MNRRLRYLWMLWAVAIAVGPAPGFGQSAPRPGAGAPEQNPATAPSDANAANAARAEIELPGGGSLLWDNGPLFRTADDSLKLRPGVLAQYDFGWIGGHDLGNQINEDLDDVSRWRRVRPRLEGEAFGKLDFELEAEFVGPDITLKDDFVRLRDIPWVGDATAGYFKEPFDLEELTGSADTTFIERALPDAFAPSRNFGVMLNNSVLDDRVTWAAGAFRNTKTCVTTSTSQGNAWALTGRATALPYYENQGSDLLHVGLDYSFRRPNEPIDFSQRPEAHFVPDFTKTGSLDADEIHLLGGELAWVRGPLSLQGQYTAALLDATGLGSKCFNGLYTQASYFLTGEHRPYDRHTGVFTGVKPSKDFLCPGGGIGAWEAAARYSFLGLDKEGLPTSARDMQDLTAGLNWYLNPYVRVSWDYIHAWLDGPGVSGGADIFLMRLQVNF